MYLFKHGNINIFGNNKIMYYLIHGFRNKFNWVKHSRCVFLNKELYNRPNAIREIWNISLLLHTTTRFGSPYKPSSGKCLIHNMNIKGERHIFTVVKSVLLLLLLLLLC
jgi:hypothetical protein